MTSPEDAEKLYQATIGADPFPNIQPALLNSADIHDYIEATGMVYPYYPKFMKSSSYEAQIGDRAFHWDQLVPMKCPVPNLGFIRRTFHKFGIVRVHHARSFDIIVDVCRI